MHFSDVNNPAIRNPIRDILKKMGRWPTIEANVETWQNNKVTNDVQTSQSLLLSPLRIVPVSNYGLNQYAQLTSPNIMTDGNMILDCLTTKMKEKLIAILIMKTILRVCQIDFFVFKNNRC